MALNNVVVQHNPPTQPTSTVGPRLSLAESLARQSNSWRDHIIGEHVQRTRFLQKPAVVTDADEAGTPSPTLSPVSVNRPPLATSNPFGPAKATVTRNAPSQSVENMPPAVYDPGRAARLQYGGGSASHDPTSITSSGSNLPTKSKSVSSGPTLPAFLRGAQASTDAGEAARRQYG